MVERSYELVYRISTYCEQSTVYVGVRVFRVFLWYWWVVCYYVAFEAVMC